MDGLWSFEPGMIVARYCGVTSHLLLRECGIHLLGWRVECLNAGKLVLSSSNIATEWLTHLKGPPEPRLAQSTKMPFRFIGFRGEWIIRSLNIFG